MLKALESARDPTGHRGALADIAVVWAKAENTEGRIHGLTTAASLWITSAIGVLFGVGMLNLALIGAGPGREGLEAFFRQAGVQDRVWLPGARSDIATLLRQLDCFVLPSLAEGTSCTLQEAMASALPIIATDVGGNARLLDHGRLGVLVPSAQVEAMAAALWAVAQDVPAARQRASLARQEAESRHSLNAMLSRYEGLFNQQG